FRTMKDLGGEITFKEGGIIAERANEVLVKAAALLKEIEQIGLFGTLERGIFADIKRGRTAGKGLTGVVQKDAVYFNPFIELMRREEEA
nr:lysine 5,6-aminomutase subunit alpha [Clostridia bacterium]